jgi:parallel beta-helix repeat protein
MERKNARWITVALIIVASGVGLEAKRPAAIAISPNSITLQTGQTRQFVATILRSSGTAVWSATGGTITSTGLYTAGSAAGSFTVKATISATSISSTTTVTITVPASTTEICGNGIDDDGDGLVDEGCSVPPPLPACADGLDNDGDGKIDLADPGCSSATDTNETDALPPPPPPSPGVQVAPGQSIQAAIDANPTGTTFVLLAGTHRLGAALVPKSGDTFVGEDGTVVSGARVLTTFSRVNGYWAVAGQTQQGPTTTYGAAPECQAAYPRCANPEDLFFDGEPLRHVDALSKVVSGTWFFDYPNNTIYFADDPSGHTVETSVTTFALVGNNLTSVTLRNLIVEKFATPAQIGAVNADGVTGWLIDGCTFQLNHGTGLSFTSSSGVTISDSRFTMQGQLGIGTFDTDGFLIVGNEIDHNNYAGFATSWEGGGDKFAWSRDMTVRDNWAHHNIGKGLWTDGNNVRTLYEGNTASDNTEHGIFHEISYDAVIRNNTVERNGWNGIVVASSPNVEIHGNTVGQNGRAQIFGRQDYAGYVGKYGEFVLFNLFVHDNVMTPGATSGSGAGVQPQNQAAGDTTYFTSKNNVFMNNTYNLTAATATPFVWMFSNRTDAQWIAYGQDVTGTLIR